MPSPENSAFARHVYAVQRYVSLTAPRYVTLFNPGVVTHPICCFGDPSDAKVITVGLNPSDGEFAPGREWPTSSMEHLLLAKRYRTYFTTPHRWFAPWSEGSKHVGASYEDGSAVHIDLSPRATRSVSDLKKWWEQELFLEMVERDLWVCLGTLKLCKKANLVMMAGSVTGRYYINEFLQRFAPDYGYSLDGVFNRLKHPGRAKVAWHELSGGDRPLKVFFAAVPRPT